MIYVDGFNLYYGALKDSSYRWLNVDALCRRLLKRHQKVVGIKYFVARVSSRPHNPRQAQRQQIYLRALETIPHLELHFGQFITGQRWRRLAEPPRRGNPMRLIEETNEKGSDVNLASHLLIDGFRARYDLAVVISNDSDLKTPIEFVREELKAPVGVWNPHGRRSFALSPQPLPRGSFYKAIRKSHLAQSQFPDQIPDANGIILKPNEWCIYPEKS